MKMILMGCVGLSCVGFAATAQAQVGRLVKEGIEAVGRKALQKTAREAVEEGTEQVLKKIVVEAGQETAEATAKRAGIIASRYTDDVARAVGKHGGAVAAPLVNTFGDDGAKALTKLSTTNARRMAMLTEEMAAGGHGADWMRVLADKGDVAAEWIWKNKKTIAVATTATAFLANPDPFLQAGETVITHSIETAGEHVARPLIEKTVEHVVPTVAKEVTRIVTAPVATVMTKSFQYPWMITFLLSGCGLLGFIVYRWYLRPWLPLWKQTANS